MKTTASLEVAQNLTVEAIEEQVTLARKEMTRKMLDAEGTTYLDSRTLGQMVAHIANAEGAAEADLVVFHSMKAATLAHAGTGGSPWKDAANMVIKELTEGVLRGADDEWSGRGNDLRREKFDGYRATARTWINVFRRVA